MLWRKTVQGYKSQERGPASNWRFTKTSGRVWGPGVGKKGGQGKGKRGGPDKGQELDLLKSLKRTDVAAVTWARKRGHRRAREARSSEHFRRSFPRTIVLDTCCPGRIINGTPSHPQKSPSFSDNCKVTLFTGHVKRFIYILSLMERSWRVLGRTMT